jgi:hypothetical protein
MAFDWSEYLAFARWLQGNTPPGVTPEAGQRSAVSRAYYAAFCHARNYARDYLGFVPREDADDHGRLRAHLKSRRRHKVGQSLERLREWRNQCDYLDTLSADLAAMLAAALQEADYVFSSLQKPPPTATGS